MPGGPCTTVTALSRPKSSYFFGCFRKSTNSMISALASSHPATSLNMIFCDRCLERGVRGYRRLEPLLRLLRLLHHRPSRPCRSSPPCVG